MTEAKHTPGPWVVGNRYTATGVYTTNGGLVANTHGAQRNFRRDEHIIEQDANARLIAAAPDMLEALRAARAEIVSLEWAHFNEFGRPGDTFDAWLSNNEALPVIDAAIAKAEGTV